MDATQDTLNNINIIFPAAFCIVLLFLIIACPFPLTLFFHLILALYFLRFIYKQWAKHSSEFKKKKALAICFLIFLTGVNFYLFAAIAIFALFYRSVDMKAQIPGYSVMIFLKSRTGILYMLMSLVLIVASVSLTYQSNVSFEHLNQIEQKQAQKIQQIDHFLKNRAGNHE